MQKIVKSLLLIFVFVSLVFLVKRISEDKASTSQVTQAVEQEDSVQVYYFHGQKRCISCKKIEALTKASLDESFKEKLGESLNWNVLNYQNEMDLAKKFDLSFSTVVVVKQEGGEIVNFQKLDGVWDRLGDELSFKQYIKDGVSLYLEQAQ